jgi:hypothetical protein
MRPEIQRETRGGEATKMPTVKKPKKPTAHTRAIDSYNATYLFGMKRERIEGIQS